MRTLRGGRAREISRAVIFLRTLAHGGQGTLTNNLNSAPPILLAIAGFDPSCGAGVAGDLKTFAAHHTYGVAAVTALTVQSTQGVTAVHPTPAPILRAQLDALVADVNIAAVKIGMLASRANAAAVAAFLDQHTFAHVVLDPVMKSSAGTAELLDAGGVKFLREELSRRPLILTPNIAEAEILAGMPIPDVAAMREAAQKLVALGPKAVIITGGHLERPVDVLSLAGGETITLGGDHVRSENTHGSGCTFSSAVAAQLAVGLPLEQSAILAKAYVTKAIEHSYAIGKGQGPLNHFYRFHMEAPARGVHEVPQHGMHPASEPTTR
jgi:hydroxymethylpyrimidine/phosphomethylpyrimidine kinase